MSNANIIIDHVEVIPPGQGGVVIDAADRWNPASEEIQRQFYNVMYGAGTFTVAAVSENHAANIAMDQRAQAMEELALPLVVPLTEDAQKYLGRRHPAGIPPVIVEVNPSHIEGPRNIPEKDRATPPSKGQMRMFSWIIHGGTGQVIYKMNV